MKNHTRVMNIRESQRLAELERVIAKGKQTFVEVGLALAEIRDLRLYKREYSNFAEYCREKWGWEKRYTNYVIAGAEAVKSLRQLIGQLQVPTLKIGDNVQKGFEKVMWNNLLDLAGYPKTAPYGAKRSGVFSQ